MWPNCRHARMLAELWSQPINRPGKISWLGCGKAVGEAVDPARHAGQLASKGGTVSIRLQSKGTGCCLELQAM